MIVSNSIDHRPIEPYPQRVGKQRHQQAGFLVVVIRVMINYPVVL